MNTHVHCAQLKAGDDKAPSKHFSDSIIVNRLQSSYSKGDEINECKNSIFERYSTGDLRNFVYVPVIERTKSVRFFASDSVTLVPRIEELVPFASAIWYSRIDLRSFKGKHK